MKIIIGIIIGFFLVYYFPIEDDIEKAFNSTNSFVDSVMDSMDEVRDIHVKLPSDGWVHGKKKGDRILIVLIDGRFSPVEAQNSVERLCQSVFKGIFV